jgi:hypothetical protein
MRIHRYVAPRMRKLRKAWGPGPWKREPDAATFQHAGLLCAVIRASMGHWCGYVLVPKGHPWHGERDVSAIVHGDVNFAQRATGGAWQLGFDCAHFYDFTPSMMEVAGLGGGARRRVRRLYARRNYRTIQYAIAETKRLAEQAREASI